LLLLVRRCISKTEAAKQLTNTKRRVLPSTQECVGALAR
jgi:hypothetical protein